MNLKEEKKNSNMTPYRLYPQTNFVDQSMLNTNSHTVTHTLIEMLTTADSASLKTQFVILRSQ